MIYYLLKYVPVSRGHVIPLSGNSDLVTFPLQLLLLLVQNMLKYLILVQAHKAYYSTALMINVDTDMYVKYLTHAASCLIISKNGGSPARVMFAAGQHYIWVADFSYSQMFLSATRLVPGGIWSSTTDSVSVC
jgi:hypothetical protein